LKSALYDGIRNIMASITMNTITATLAFHDISWTLRLSSDTNVASIKGTVHDSTDHSLMFNNQEATVSFHKTHDRIYWTLTDKISYERGHIMLPELTEEPDELWSSWVGKN
jgi:hypothetical protein